MTTLKILPFTQFSNLAIYFALLVQAQWCFVGFFFFWLVLLFFFFFSFLSFFFCKWNLTFSFVSNQSYFSLFLNFQVIWNFTETLFLFCPDETLQCLPITVWINFKFFLIANIALENFISASQIRCLLKHFFYLVSMSQVFQISVCI